MTDQFYDIREDDILLLPKNRLLCV